MSELKLRPGDQPLPIRNDEPDIQCQVIADIKERRQVGILRYGTALQPFNGRDALRDLYEELLDGAMYARQVMAEREHSRDELVGTLLALRAQWEERRRALEARTEWADLPAARDMASERTLAHVIRDLDQVLDALGVRRG